MLYKLCLVAVALLGVTASSGCQTLPGSCPGGCNGGCSGGSCATGQSTYAPSQDGYAPSQGGSGLGGGSGSR